MNKISSKHYIFLILIVSAISLRSYSSIFIDLGDRDTWVAAIIAGIIYIAFSFFIFYVCKKTDTFDFKEIFELTYPKTLSNIFIFLFSLHLFITSVETAAIQADSIHTNIFLETPVWYSLLLFIIPTAYLITRRLDTIMIVVIISCAFIYISVFIVEIFTFKYIKPQLLLPIMGYGVSKKFIYAVLLILGSFASTAITFPFLKYMDKKNKFLKYTTLTNIFVVFIVVISIAAAIGTFGPLRACNIYYPEFIRVQRIQIDGFIEFGDLFFIAKTVCIWTLKYTLAVIAIRHIYSNIFTNKILFSIIYSILVFVLALPLARHHYLLFDLLKLYKLISLIVFCLLPFVTFLIYYIKWRKKLIPDIKSKNTNKNIT